MADRIHDQVIGEEVTITAVAVILGLARPLVLRRMEVGDLPYRTAGGDRLCRLEDVLALKRDIDARQRIMDALAADSDDLREAYGL